MVVALPAGDMADDDQFAAGAEGVATIASQVASICAMIEGHLVTEKPMSARRVDAISAMIDDVAAASERMTTISKKTSKKPRQMRSTDCYERLFALGEGSTAVVTKARDLTTGQTVALKTIREGFLSASGGELLREACLMAACSGHPSIVALHGVARAPGTKNDFSLVMEHAGPSLHRVLRDRMRRTGRPFSEPETRRVMRQLLSAAKAMHGHGVVHRDIKTENVLLDGSGNNFKIADFGSAMSLAGQMISADVYWDAGTTHCSAPEMLLETPGYDARVDAWSLGCVMAELLTGEVLFNEHCGSDQLHLIYDVLGVPGKKAWKPHESSFVADKEPQWRREQQQRRRQAGKGGGTATGCASCSPRSCCPRRDSRSSKGSPHDLTCNPSKRLTATDALKLPWFADKDDAPVENCATM